MKAWILLLLCGACTLPPVQDRSYRANINGLLASRSLDDPKWEPVEQHTAWGVEADVRHASFPVGLEVGYQHSQDDQTQHAMAGTIVLNSMTREVEVSEVYVGPRLTLQVIDTGWHVYTGTGATFLDAEYTFTNNGMVSKADDSTVAWYLHAGAYYQFDFGLNLGADLRTVFDADVELFGTKADADYVQAGIFMGFGF